MAEIITTFGGLTFSNTGDPTFTIDTLDGWYSGPPIRSIVDDRPNANGAFGVATVFKGARVITQTGLIVAASAEAAMVDSWSAFSGLQGNGAPSDFEVTDANGSLSVEATLAAPPEITPIVDGIAAYVLQLVARDPVKYGPATTASTGLPTSGGGLEYELGEPSEALYYGALGNLGRVTLINSGSADTWPVFTVNGALDAGFYLQRLDTGDVIRYDRVVPAGSTVSIDTRTGEVLVDATSDASTYLTRDDFSSVPAGGSAEWQFNAISGSSGTPTLEASYRSGWW